MIQTMSSIVGNALAGVAQKSESLSLVIFAFSWMS
jgi:hypothetical protein